MEKLTVRVLNILFLITLITLIDHFSIKFIIILVYLFIHPKKMIVVVSETIWYGETKVQYELSW